MTSQTIVGKPTKRIEGDKKVTGVTKYTDDLSVPGMLQARLVTSIQAHAEIVSIDTGAAKAVPGVVAVYTGKDVHPDGPEPSDRSSSMLARDKVIYYGQPVAVVLAETATAAEEAAELVQVEYRDLGAVVDPLAAMEPDAPVIRPRTGATEWAEGGAHGTNVAGGSVDTSQLSDNVTNSTAFSRGNVAQGFAEADAVVERQYRSGFVHQSYMEPHASLVVPDALGKLTVYTMTQGQFGTRDGIAENLGLDPNDVKVVNMEVGGAFGSKWMLLEPLAGWMALRHQRPVKIGVDRSTEFTVSTPAGGAVIDVKIGGKRDGTLTAIQARLVYDSGCYSASPYNIGALLLGSYYQCEHLDIASYEVLTNKPGVGAYRAPGAPHATFAIEQAVDELAVTLGLDPVAFRLRNASAEGQPQAHGTPWPSIGIRQILETIQQHPIWRERGGKPNSGVGVAIGGWLGGIEPCAANLKVNSSGELTLTLGHADITGTNTTFAMLAAEAFGTTLDNVKVVIGDTDVAPYAGFAGGSKTTYTVGNAVLRAAQDARWQVLDIAASELEASPDDLELVDGKVRVKGSEREISIAEAAQLSQTFGGRYEPVYGIGKSAVTDRAPGFSGQIAEVSVDPETGEVRLERYATIQDVGRALNPAAVEGQMLGGTVQAIGFGLYESMVYDENGQLLSGSFMDYSLPKAHQLPSMEAIMLEIPAPAGPLGAKGIGEPPIVPGAAAIANAVAAATGKRVTEMPMTPERVIAVLNNGSGA